MVIPAFTGSTIADLQIPCTFDFNVAATKYFHGVSDGEIPLSLLFSGTLFYAGPEGALAGGAHPVGQRSALSVARCKCGGK